MTFVISCLSGFTWVLLTSYRQAVIVTSVMSCLSGFTWVSLTSYRQAVSDMTFVMPCPSGFTWVSLTSYWQTVIWPLSCLVFLAFRVFHLRHTDKQWYDLCHVLSFWLYVSFTCVISTGSNCVIPVSIDCVIPTSSDMILAVDGVLNVKTQSISSTDQLLFYLNTIGQI